MKNIKIFIAGSKELTDERNSIIILANELNSIYNSKNVVITIHSYEHFNDKQDEYNNFIEEESDIVIFILDGYIGSKTEEEFFKATGSLYKNNRPEVIVFLHTFENITPEIARIQGLVDGRLEGRYHVDYSSLEDLKAKARERIVRYIDSRTKEMGVVKEVAQTNDNSASEFKKPNLSKQKTNILLFSMLGVIMTLLVALCWSLHTSSNLLFFAGGGSVKNYIEQTKGIDINNYPHAVYANLASGYAWALLTEEANRYQEDGGRSKDRFTSICLSADDIDSSFFDEKTKGVYANARIIRYNLGTDSLVVYVHNKILSDKLISKDLKSISVDSLRSLVKYALSRTEEMRLFTTSKSSGTLRFYQSCFEDGDSIDLEKLLDTKQSFLFYKKSSSSYINALDIPNGNLPYVILGSKYYFPETIISEKSDQYHAFYVINGDKCIQKPINLYFVGKYDKKDPNYCTIKKPIVKFLQDIHADKDISEEAWKELRAGRIKTDGGNLILRLN